MHGCACACLPCTHPTPLPCPRHCRALYDNHLSGVVPPLPFSQYTDFCNIGGTNDFACPLPDGAADCGDPYCGPAGVCHGQIAQAQCDA